MVATAIGLAGLAAPPPASGQAAAPPAAAAQPAKEATEERLPLTTSDEVALAAWYYPVAKPEPDSPPPAVVILLHDLGGSHATVEPLARDLRSRGIAVVAPDLRGHGATKGPAARGLMEPKTLKKTDFDAMAATGGGLVRDQAQTYGDVETVWTWVKAQAAAGKLDGDRLVVVGSGLGAAVAAHWTAEDARWAPLASGKQGQNVRGLVLLSPDWATRGFSIAPPLQTAALRRTLPMLLIGGAEDADTVKLYEQMKRQRPDAWSERKTGQEATVQSPDLAKDALPTLFLRQLAVKASGDQLAALAAKDVRGGSPPAEIIEGFVKAVTAAKR